MRRFLTMLLMLICTVHSTLLFGETGQVLEELLPSSCLLAVSLDDVPGWLSEFPETPLGAVMAQEAFQSCVEDLPTEWSSLVNGAGGYEILFSGQVLLAVISLPEEEGVPSPPFSLVLLSRTRLTRTVLASLLPAVTSQLDHELDVVPLQKEEPTAWRLDESLYVGLIGDVFLLTDRESTLSSVKALALDESNQVVTLAESELYAPSLAQKEATVRLFLDVRGWLDTMLEVSSEEDASAMKTFLERLGVANIEQAWMVSRWDPSLRQYQHEGELRFEGALTGIFKGMISLEGKEEVWELCSSDKTYVSATGVDWSVIYSVIQDILETLPGETQGMDSLENQVQESLGVSLEQILCQSLGSWAVAFQDPGYPPRATLIHSLDEASIAKTVCENLYALSLDAKEAQFRISRQMEDDVPVYSLCILPFLMDSPGWAVQDDRLILSSSTSTVLEAVRGEGQDSSEKLMEESSFALASQKTAGALTSFYWVTPPKTLKPIVFPFPTTPLDMEKASQPAPEKILECEMRLRAIRAALWDYHDEHGCFPSTLEGLLDGPYGLSSEDIGCPAGPPGNRYFYRSELDPNETELWVGDKEAYHDGVGMGLFSDGRVDRVDPSSQGDLHSPSWKQSQWKQLDLGMLRPSWGFTKLQEDRVVFRAQRNFLLPDSFVLGALALLPHLDGFLEQLDKSIPKPQASLEM